MFRESVCVALDTRLRGYGIRGDYSVVVKG
jgi:hypothetical protein